jgi:MFS family permease
MIDQERTTEADRPIGELVQQVAQQTSTLVRQELELARAELTRTGKQAGATAGMFGAAGLVALFACGALVAAAILGLATAVAGWLAALIVAAALGVVAGILALSGRGSARRIHPVPEETVSTLQEDVRYVKDRAKEGRG